MEPLWLKIARSKLGTREVPGPKSNPQIVKWIHDDLGIEAYKDDGTAWCAGFANYCLKMAGEANTMSLAARSFINYGQPAKPQLGAILVFKRGTQSWQGHVGFYVGETATHYKVLGGNQGDSVSIREYPKSALLACRMPARAKSSKVIQGSMISLAGFSGSGLAEVADGLNQTSGQLQMVADYSTTIQIVCLIIGLIGIGVTVWARLKMLREEREAGGVE